MHLLVVFHSSCFHVLSFTDVDECAENKDDCDNEHMSCVNKEGGYKCVCDEGYEKNDVDACVKKPNGKIILRHWICLSLLSFSAF